MGGITALIGGGNFAQGAAAAGLGEVAASQLKDRIQRDPVLQNAVATIVGTLVGGGQGGLIAGSADKFNRQLHLSEKTLIEENAARFAQEIGLCSDAQNCSPDKIQTAQRLLTRQALRQVDLEFSKQFAENAKARAFLEEIGTIVTSLGRGQFDKKVKFVATGDVFKDHKNSIENIYQLQDVYKGAIGDDAVRTLKILNAAYNSSAYRATIGARDGSVDTIGGMIDLAVLLVKDPDKLKDIAQAIYDNPELLLDGAIEPFKDRYDAGDIAGAVGYALPVILEVAAGTKGVVTGVSTTIKTGKIGVDDLKNIVDNTVENRKAKTPDNQPNIQTASKLDGNKLHKINFPEIERAVSPQKQSRHVAGSRTYRGGGVFDSQADAQKVLDAYHSGGAKILGKDSHGNPIVKFDGVIGTNINTAKNITRESLNKFA